MTSLGVVAAACGASGAATPKATGSVAMEMSMGGNELKYWQAVVDKWNQTKTPHINMTYTAFDPKVGYKTALAGNAPPDISFMLSDPDYIGPVADARLVVNLHDYAQKYGWKQRYDPEVWDYLLYKDKLYQIGFEALPHPFVWYNKAIFTKLGLTVPNNRLPSLDQFKSYVQAAKSASLQPIALGDKELWPGAQFVSIMIHRFLDHSALTKLRAGWREKSSGVKWTDPKVVAALQAAQQAVRDGWFANGLVAMTDGDAANLLANGKSAMYQTGYWGVYTIPQVAPNVDLDFFQYPLMDSKVPASIINFPGSGVVISSKSKNQDVAAELVNFGLQPEQQAMLVEQFSLDPATKLGTKGLKVSGTWQHMLDVVSTTPSHPFQIEADAPHALVTQVMTDIQSFLNLSLSPRDLASHIQQAIDSNHD